MRKIIFNSNQNIRPIWRILLFIVVIFAINIPLQIGLQKILDQSLLRGYISASIYFACVIFSLFIQIKFIDKSSFKKYGLKINKTWLQEFALGFIISLILLSLFFLAMYLTGNLKIVDYFTTKSSEYSFVEGFLSESFGLIVGTSVEEIFFRAFLFYALYEAFRTIQKDSIKRAFWALIIISPLFGIAHFDNEGATILSTINLSLDGMMICLPFLITARLGMSIGLHFSWNLVQGAFFGFPISGNIAKASIISIETSENIFTGGKFGPEGSIFFLLLNILAIVFILLWKKFKNYNTMVNPFLIKNDTDINQRKTSR